MPIEIHIHHHDAAVSAKLDRIVQILEGILHMSETIESEQSAIQSLIATLTTAVTTSAGKFADLAQKLQAALDAATQQGFTTAQLAGFDSIKGELTDEAARLNAAAQAADPDPVSPPPPVDTTTGGQGSDTVAAPAGDDSVSGPSGDDTVGGPTGDDTLDGGAGNDSLPV